MLTARSNRFATKKLVTHLATKGYTGYNRASFHAGQGKLSTNTMGNGGEYISAWPTSEPWRDPIPPSSNSEPASSPKGINAKDVQARGPKAQEGYSAVEAAQDARNGAFLTAWPAGENRGVPPVSMSMP